MSRTRKSEESEAPATKTVDQLRERLTEIEAEERVLTDKAAELHAERCDIQVTIDRAE